MFCFIETFLIFVRCALCQRCFAAVIFHNLLSVCLPSECNPFAGMIPLKLKPPSVELPSPLDALKPQIDLSFRTIGFLDFVHRPVF
jgi:hypothetical protein